MSAAYPVRDAIGLALAYKRAVIGGEAQAGCVVEVVDTLNETYVAFFAAEVKYERFVLLLNAFYRAPFEDWEPVKKMPHRAVDEKNGEVCFRYLSSRTN
jgi:hypothetical protein